MIFHLLKTRYIQFKLMNFEYTFNNIWYSVKRIINFRWILQLYKYNSTTSKIVATIYSIFWFMQLSYLPMKSVSCCNDVICFHFLIVSSIVKTKENDRLPPRISLCYFQAFYLTYFTLTNTIKISHWREEKTFKVHSYYPKFNNLQLMSILHYSQSTDFSVVRSTLFQKPYA